MLTCARARACARVRVSIGCACIHLYALCSIAPPSPSIPFLIFVPLQTDAKWTAYFKAVYGEIPEQYPVCIFDFWSINKEAYNAVGLAGSHTFQSNPKDVQVGDLFNGISGQYMIYHSQWTPVPNNTWVEVQHAVFPTELVGAWVWSVRGAGIFVNTGSLPVS